MGSRIDRNVGSEQRASTDGYKAGVDDCAVEVDEDALAHAHVRAVVNVNRRLDPRVGGEECFVFVFCWSWWRDGFVVCYDSTWMFSVVVSCARLYNDQAACHSRSPEFDLGSTVCQVCVVEVVAGCSTSSTGFDQFGRECVIKLSSERTS